MEAKDKSLRKFLEIIYLVYLIIGLVLPEKMDNEVIVIIWIHFVVLIVFRRVLAFSYKIWLRLRRKSLAPEKERIYIDIRSECFSGKVVVWEPIIIFIVYVFVLKNHMSSVVFGMIAGILLPIASFLELLYTSGKPEIIKAVEAIRKVPAKDLHKEKIWLLLNQSKSCDRNCYSVYDNELFAHFVYLLTIDELKKLYPKGNDEQQIKEQTGYWCYAVNADTKEALKACFDKAYEEYKRVSNDGHRKVVILNIGNKEPLQEPVEYRTREFFYYAEVPSITDVDGKFLDKVSGNAADGFKAKPRRRKSKNAEKQLQKERVALNDKRKNYFEHPDAFVEKINESVAFDSDIRGGNEWLTNFYSSACVFQTPTRAVMALLDYWELLLRLVAIYYYKSGAVICEEHDIVHSNLTNLGNTVLRGAKSDEKKYKQLTEAYQVPEIIKAYFESLKEYIYIHFEGEEVSFQGLISTMQVLRNKIIAHGVLSEENASIVWGIVYWATVLLNDYLDLPQFRLEEFNDTYKVGYDVTVAADGLIMCRNHVPCIAAMEKSNKKSYIYVNFFNGELITPEYIMAE